MEKAQKILYIILLVSLTLASWATTLNQLEAFLDRASLRHAMTQAIAGCMEYGSIEAVIVEEEIYCVKVLSGLTIYMPLERLHKGEGQP